MASARIAPSILSADFSRLGEEVRAVERAGADIIHVDVMDGHFVPNITIGPLVVRDLRQVTELPLDCHLMIENPDDYVGDFVEAGADMISVHAEACRHLHRSVHLIQSLNVQAGVALNPATPLDAIDAILEDLDFVLLMSVNPGFGGQSFIESVLTKVARLRAMAAERNPELKIEIDGGIKLSNAARVREAGVDWFVAGSAIFKTENYAETIRRFKEEVGAFDGA
jgi:ribulose-phosphate 3-epimerase